MKNFTLLRDFVIKVCRTTLVAAVISVMLLGSAEATAAQKQDKMGTMRLHSGSLVQLFEALEQQNGYSFIWDEKLRTKLQQRVSLDVSQIPIEQVLSSKLAGTGLTFKIIENQVMIKSEAAVENIFSML